MLACAARASAGALMPGHRRLVRCSTMASFHVGAGRRLNQQVAQRFIVDWENLLAVYAVVVEKPTCQQEGGTFVAFPEGLRVRNSKSQLARRNDWVDFITNGIDGSNHALEIIGFIEPLIGLTDGLVDCDGEVDCGQPQWSRR